MTIRDLKDCISIDEDMILEYVRQNYEPDHVFDVNALEYWAEKSGFLNEFALRNGFEIKK